MFKRSLLSPCLGLKSKRISLHWVWREQTALRCHYLSIRLYGEAMQRLCIQNLISQRFMWLSLGSLSWPPWWHCCSEALCHVVVYKSMEEMLHTFCIGHGKILEWVGIWVHRMLGGQKIIWICCVWWWYKTANLEQWSWWDGSLTKFSETQLCGLSD